MNPRKHALLSVRRRGGVEDDYLAIHTFLDHTKSLCADLRHRILHTMWGVNYVVVPIFGEFLVNSEGHKVDIKDMCERDHLLADFSNKFIPTLSDFVDAIDEDKLQHYLPDYKQKLEQFHQRYIHDQHMSELMLSPLSHSGKVKSLLITHNSWFVNEILPKIFHCKPIIDDFLIRPDDLFNSIKFEMWMDNGIAIPESARMLQKRLIAR